ncbi:MAG: alpha/beta hydrolase [Pseudomonadota bacterium]|nr:alpha/beta hydrolase [Pseudomonadota bacterium]
MSIRQVGGVDLWVEQGGTSNGPTLLLMHGLSGTGGVWSGLRPLLEKYWPGSWVIPDLRGHGRSAHSENYGIACHATDMAELVRGSDELYLAGHSMGGLVGILMASGWFGVAPKAVVTAGVKLNWTEKEYLGLKKLIEMPVRWFKTEKEARERFVLVTGLRGVIDPASEFARTGIRQEKGKWRLAADNRTAMVAYADAPDIYNAARSPITLAAGEFDQMVSAAALKVLNPLAEEIPGLGHNLHVENPSAFWKLISKTTGMN